MQSRVFTATTIGIASYLIEVEVDISFGLSNFCIVGLPDKAIRESKDRVRAALKNSGFKFPEKLITVNLAPAHLKKQDSLFDVPIAVAVLQAAGLLGLEKKFLDEAVFLGELGLDGGIRRVCGVLPMVHGAMLAGKKRLFVPVENAAEAVLVEGVEVIGVRTLVELVAHLRGERELPRIERVPLTSLGVKTGPGAMPMDFEQVRGQGLAKRALQIAAAGGHNVLFVGPPGGGKTMLAQRFGTILPPMDFELAMQTTKIYSVAGLLGDKPMVSERPFRSPHHTVSIAGLVGGGTNPRPGEISLAHNGVLFLDELTEFGRHTIEALRQPLESKMVTISRVGMVAEYPSAFRLVVALNPCPCGFYGDNARRCSCTESEVARYIGKLSGPLMDRIDLHLQVPAVKYEELAARGGVELGSAHMRERVSWAMEFRKKRQGDVANADLTAAQVGIFCLLEDDAEKLVKTAFEKLGMSARGYHKVLKIARTVADFDGSDWIGARHVKEALLYRFLDKRAEVS